MYKGKVFVIKTGGGAFRDASTMRAFMEQVAILHHLAIRVVLVHGGGPAARRGDQEARRGDAHGAGPPRDGRGCDRRDQHGAERPHQHAPARARPRVRIAAIGLSGVDGGLVKAHRRAPVTLASGEVVDYGMVGDIDGVDASVITRLLDAGFLPVVSPLSADPSGQLLNINADTVAAAIAAPWMRKS